MTTKAYRLTTTTPSASAGAVHETVVITAEDDGEAVELARAYVEAVGAEALSSAILTDASGAEIWREGDQGDGFPVGSSRTGSSV